MQRAQNTKIGKTPTATIFGWNNSPLPLPLVPEVAMPASKQAACRLAGAAQTRGGNLLQSQGRVPQMEDSDYFGVRLQAVADVARLSHKAGGAHERRESFSFLASVLTTCAARLHPPRAAPAAAHSAHIHNGNIPHSRRHDRARAAEGARRTHKNRATTGRLACTWHLVRAP